MKVGNSGKMPSYPVQRQRKPQGAEGTVSGNEKNFDRCSIKRTDALPPQDPTQTVDQVANALRKQYPWVSFTFAQVGDQKEDIPQFVVSAGAGVHMVIDPDVLEWMAQGQDTWLQGMEMIGKTLHELMLKNDADAYSKGAVIGEDGETTIWSAKWERPKTDLEKNFKYMKDILDRQDEARKRQEEQQKKMKLEQKKKLNYQMGKDLTRLAKGRTDRDVRSLISRMYASRQKIAVSSSYSKREIQMAVAQMDYVIGRARAKIRHLKDEGEMQQQVQKAEKQREEKLKMKLEQELKNRRRNRMAKERAAIHKKLPDLPGLRDEDERREAQAEMALGGSEANAISGAWAPASPVDSGGSAVTVSTPSGAAVEVTMTQMA